MPLGQFLAQGVFDGTRHARRQIDLVKRIAVALEKTNVVAGQLKNVVAIDRLQKAPQGLGMKAVGHDGQFVHRPLQAEHVKHARPAQHGESIQGMAPESSIVSEGCKRFQKLPGLGGRMLLQQRCHPSPE